MGLSSSKTATLKTSHAAPRIGLGTLTPLGGGGGGGGRGGVNYCGGYRGCSSGWGGPKRSLTLPLLFRDQSLSSLFFCGDLSRSPHLLGLRSRFFSSLLFSFRVEELPHLDKSASSPLMYFSTLASTSAMLACGFFKIENIKSLDYMPIPTIKAVMVNFSFGMSTLNDSELNLWT